MPNRKSRADLLRRLTTLWDKYYTKQSYLKSVRIGDGSPLRGIKNSTLEIGFPVIVICGTNGTGKTTFLALSTLAFHAAKQPLSAAKKSNYYEFKDFFVPVARDPHPAGIVVEWKYTDGPSDKIKKGKQRWLRYIRNSGKPRRPVRGTEFVGISRITPAFEKKNYGSYFSRRRGISESDSSDIITYMSRILSKPYSQLKELEFTNSSGSFKARHYNSSHTSFNAGAGEECIFSILRALVGAPEGAFVAIEEIEIGLHPSTLGRMVDCIMEIAHDRKLQVMITSHSPDFLRACPAKMLVLAERVKDEVHFIPEPNVEQAIRAIGGETKPQALVICEDELARSLIEASLPTNIRNMAPVVAYGGKDQLAERAAIVSKSSPGMKIVIVWDGEVPSSEIEKASNLGFLGLKLPGISEPEKYISDALLSDGEDFLITDYGISSSDFIKIQEEIRSSEDVHDHPYIICSHLGIDESEFKVIVRHVAKAKKAEFEAITAGITLATSVSVGEFEEIVRTKSF